MNNSKKINVNYSSLVGLKAELLRKQTEVKDAKVNADGVRIEPKHKVKNKKSKPTKLKIEKELIDTDDIKAHKKSKLMLEAKARLYENLKKSHSNKNEHFLVDFENKSESEEEAVNSDDYEDANSDPEEDWVEYQDCFGRTRKCLRRDLSTMQEKDDFVKQEVMKKSQADSAVEDIRPETVKIIPKEPEIEIMRRKWEEQTEKLTEKVNIHYQDVLFDEARAHGVGYYEFSQDEEVRAKQQLNLDALRKETIQKQKEMQNLKELKDKMEQNRLKAARIRQRIRAGLPPEPTEEEHEENDEKDEDNTKSKADTEEENEAEKKQVTEYKEQNSLVEIEDKIKAFGELLGKRTERHIMSQEEWVHKRRKVRDSEFAPVYSDFKSAGYLEGRKVDFENSRATTFLLRDENSDNKSDPEIIISDDCRKGEFKIKNEVSETIDYKKHGESFANSRAQAMANETITIVDEESSNSDDSDIIGPMPLSTELPKQKSSTEEVLSEFPENVRTELSHIDFSKPPPNMRIETAPVIFIPDLGQAMPIPVPPPNFIHLPPMEYNLPVPELSDLQEIDSKSSDNSGSQILQPNLDENNITAGLRYLRENFEQKKKS